MAGNEKFYNLPVEEAARILATDTKRGLFGAEVKNRLAEFGLNQLRGKKGPTPLSIFLDQFRDFIVWVLIGAAFVSGFLKEWVDALAIIAIVVLNAILGFIQEYRAEKSLAALKKLSSPTSKVIRDGIRSVIPSSQLVPGDLIELEAGDNIPADSRITYATSNFAVHEASLTGESTPVIKTTLPLEEDEVPLADRANMVYMGTFVVSGKAQALAVGTGMATELGKIAGMIQEIEEETTPLQKRLEKFGKWIVYLCFVLVAIVFLLGVLRGGKLLDMFLTAVSLAVAAIPEGLPAVVTISLALGVQRMVKRHALIRKLPSVETLGSATVICSDKTGTLTKNEMTVKTVYAGGKLFNVTGVGYEPVGEFKLEGRQANTADHKALNDVLVCGVLCNGAELRRDGPGYKMIGDPTEGSLLTAAAKAAIYKETMEKEHPFIEEIPFDPERKKMSVIRANPQAGKSAFIKGAPDILLNDCTHIEEDGAKRALTDSDRENILKANASLADQAMRVLGLAYKDLGEAQGPYSVERVERDLTFLGLIAMIDPPREEVKEAINECKSAGIKIVMITGDHKNTAVAIARELGFFKDKSRALTGEELDRIEDDRFNKEVRDISVYARVSPQHKLRIVKAWRGLGEIVAMTGDGVNDAPAVKEADIGVAMGITGTDVTKEVSDMVVTDDNFASIVAAVEEGRAIYSNIKKFIHYLLSCNTGEILVMFVSTLMGLPVPLLPIHILWVNLVTDGFPALALGMDPKEPDIMLQPPRPARESVITRQGVFLMLMQGAFIAFCSLLAFTFVLFVEKEDIGRARTAAFIVLAVSQLFHSFNCRNMRESLFKIGVLTNKKLVLATLVSFLLQISVVCLPFARTIFKTEFLSVFDWTIVITISSFPLWAMEIVKMVNRRRGL